MTDITPTPELINAAKWLRKIADQTSNPDSTRRQAALLLQALPKSITEPLVTAPGRYLGYDKVSMRDIVVTVDVGGEFFYGPYGDTPMAEPQRFAPFHRLVIEREPITREQAMTLVTAYAEQMVDEHEHADAILALANRADQ